MLTKILFTLAVAAVVFGVARVRSQWTARPPSEHELVARRARRRAAVLVAGGLVAAAAAFYWQFWRSWHEVVTVRVINDQTRTESSYRAYRGSLEERSFETVDGWRVTVSDQERVEVRGR